MLKNYRLCLLCGIAAAIIAILLCSAGSTTAAEPVSFIRDVAPVLKEHCFTCHDAKKKAGKYDMTTFASLLAGGENKVIVAGQPGESDVHALMVTSDPRRMPPRDKGTAVPREQVEIVRQWIAEGAKPDAGLDPNADLVVELRRRWSPPLPPKEYRATVPVSAIAFTPNGKHVIVGGQHELTVWDTATGKLVKRLRTRTERAYGLAFLNNGLLAVAGGRPGLEGDLRIYDITGSGESLDGVHDRKVLVTHLFDTDDAILCLTISQDGTRLAAGGTDRLVRVWDVSTTTTPKLEQTIDNHTDWVLGCCFTPDGKYLFTASRDKTAKVWDLARKESLHTISEHQSIVYGVAAKADSSEGYSVGADKLLRTWPVAANGKPLKSTANHGDEIYSIVASPAKNLLFTASADRTVRSWEAMEKFPQSKRFEGLKAAATALAVSGDGSLVAAGTGDGEIRIWKTADAALLTTFCSCPGFTADIKH